MPFIRAWACADCPGFLVLRAAPAPASTVVSEPQITQKRPDVHNIVLSIKLRFPPTQKKYQFRGLSTDLYSFSSFWALFGEGGSNQILRTRILWTPRLFWKSTNLIPTKVTEFQPRDLRFWGFPKCRCRTVMNYQMNSLGICHGNSSELNWGKFAEKYSPVGNACGDTVPPKMCFLLSPSMTWLLHGPLDICVDLLPAAPLRPVQKRDGEHELRAYKSPLTWNSCQNNLGAPKGHPSKWHVETSKIPGQF